MADSLKTTGPADKRNPADPEKKSHPELLTVFDIWADGLDWDFTELDAQETAGANQPQLFKNEP